MAALRYRLARELRAQWRPMLAIALLLGVAGGIALAAAAGARRTASAYDRMLAATRPADVLVNPDLGDRSKLTPKMIAALPMVEKLAFVPFLIVVPHFARTPDAVPAAAASADGVFGYELNRPNLVAGRLPDPRRANEVLVNKEYADQAHVGVGSRIRAGTVSSGELQSVQVQTDQEFISSVRDGKVGRQLTFVVTGVGVGEDEVVVDAGHELPMLFLTPAYYRAHATDRVGYWGAFVKLRRGARDVQPFRDAVQSVADRFHEGVAFKTAAATRQATLRAIRPQAVALALFASIVALAGLLLGAQALARRLFIDAREYPALRSIGLTSRELFVGSMLAVVMVAGAGLVVAFAVAFASSGRFPVGPARLAEPSPGLTVDPSMFVLCALVMLALVALFLVWPAWRLAVGDVRERRTRPSRVAGALARAGSPPALLTGVRHAFERGRGRTAVPVVTTFMAGIGAMAVVVASLTFATSLDHLARTPRLYGYNWDRTFTVGVDGETDPATYQRFLSASATAAATALNESRDVRGWSFFEDSSMTLDGHKVQAVGFERGGGDVTPTVASGRAPITDREIALGRLTMNELSVAVGDTVRATYGKQSAELTVVGQAVLSALGRYQGQDQTSIGGGAVVTRATLRRLAPPFTISNAAVRLSAKAGSESRARAAMQSAIRGSLSKVLPELASTTSVSVTPPQRPTDVQNYERIRTTPMVLAGVLALLAGAAVAHALVTAIRTRRRELAILRCEGCTRRQVVGMIAVHASTIAIVSAIVGIPLGIALGRVAWTALADSIGAVATPVVPWAVLLLVPAVLVIANVVAILPARRAARVVPATALRSE